MAERVPPMSRTIRAINLTTAAGATALVVWSLWPGYASGFVACLVLPLVALLGVAWLVAASRLWSAARAGRAPYPPRHLLVAPALVCLTLVLLLFYVPRRVAFAACKGRFDRHVGAAPAGGYEGAVLDARLGIYHVDRYAADPRGGVYFRTGTTPDGIGPDTVSHGFAYRPNDVGTPFGSARYMVRPLHGGWYWYRASNDY